MKSHSQKEIEKKMDSLSLDLTLLFSEAEFNHFFHFWRPDNWLAIYLNFLKGQE